MKYKRMLFSLVLSAVPAALIAFVVSGCTGPGAFDNVPPYVRPSGGASGTECEAPVTGNPEIVNVILGQSHCADDDYSLIAGYYSGAIFTNFQVLQFTASSTNVIIFNNVDGQSHTAANLGPWTGSYPPVGPNPTATASPQGYDIGTTGFTTGIMAPGKQSKGYVANTPGLYVLGCGFHYVQSEMRTVVIVQ